MQERLIVTVQQSGGFAGIMRPPITLDTASLPPEKERELRQKVAAADVFHLHVNPLDSQGADRFMYTVTVQSGERTAVVDTGEGAGNPALQELIQYVRTQARQP